MRLGAVVESLAGQTGPIWQPRQVCYRCHKAAATCICESIRQVANRTGVFVLQHPRERFHSIGTVRIARLGLRKVRVQACAPWENNDRALSRIPDGAALLYPSAVAQRLDRLSASECPRDLVILDGTWFQAKKIYDACPALQRMPAVTLPPSSSGYRIRREPKQGYLSTIEAIVAALWILEPDTTGLDHLLAAFAAMIDRQIELGAVGDRSLTDGLR